MQLQVQVQLVQQVQGVQRALPLQVEPAVAAAVDAAAAAVDAAADAAGDAAVAAAVEAETMLTSVPPPEQVEARL